MESFGDFAVNISGIGVNLDRDRVMLYTYENLYIR